jgi:membrane protease YdiL (CAAX protease family)
MEEHAGPEVQRNAGGTCMKYLPLVEALLVYVAMITVPGMAGRSITKWQLDYYGGTPFNHVFLLVLLPLAIVVLCRRSPLSVGLTFSDPKAQWRIGWRSALVFFLAAWPVGALQAFGIGYRTLPGAIVLTLVNILAIHVLTRQLGSLPQPHTNAPSGNPLLILALVPVAALGAMTAVAPFSPRFSNVLFTLFLIGLGEEIFWRGYIQSRLNDVFGRPYAFRGISWGPGLVITAVLFGVTHPIFGGIAQWPWALWTAVMGVALGLIREKANSVLPGAFAHGLFDLPIVFFG